VIQEVDVLSKREVRVLREIEEGLTLRSRRAELLIILGASVLATMCMVLAQVGAGLVAAVFAVAVFALHRAWVWRPGQRPWRTGWWRRWAE
jgi:hypothetical protein